MDKEKLAGIVRRCQAGDRQAQEELILATQDTVYYQCRKMLKNGQDAEDTTQEILIAMLKGLNSLKEPEAFWGWLHRIIANRCKNMLTRGPRDLPVLEDEEGHSMLDSFEEEDEQVVPDKALDNSETRRMIAELVDALPPEQRSCVLMYYYSELSVKEIAAAAEVPENTVKSRLNYARRSIREGVQRYEKQGVKLYGFSPLPFILYFLRKDAAASGMSEAAKQSIASAVLSGAQTAASVASAASSAASAAESGATITAAAKAAGSAATSRASVFTSIGAALGISTVAVKVIAAVTAAAIAIGVFTYLEKDDDEKRDDENTDISGILTGITDESPDNGETGEIPGLSDLFGEDEEAQEPVYAQVVDGFQSSIDLRPYSDYIDFTVEYESATDVLDYFYASYYYTQAGIDQSAQRYLHSYQQWFTRAMDLSTENVMVFSHKGDHLSLTPEEVMSAIVWTDGVVDMASSFGESYYSLRVTTEFGTIDIGEYATFFVYFGADILDDSGLEGEERRIYSNQVRLWALNHLMGRQLTDVEAALFLMGGSPTDVNYPFYSAWHHLQSELSLPMIYITGDGGYCLY